MEKTGSAIIDGSISVNNFLTPLLSRGLTTPSSEHRSSHPPMSSVLLSPFSIDSCHTLRFPHIRFVRTEPMSVFTLKTHVPDVCITLFSFCQFFSLVTKLETFCAMSLQSMPPVSSLPGRPDSLFTLSLFPPSSFSQVEPLQGSLYQGPSD